MEQLRAHNLLDGEACGSERLYSNYGKPPTYNPTPQPLSCNLCHVVQYSYNMPSILRVANSDIVDTFEESLS